MIVVTSPRPGRLAGACTATLLLLTATFLAAQAPPAAAPQVPSSLTHSAEPPAPMPEPPDGVWHTDAEGRSYFPHLIPKVEGEYRWVDDTHIVLRYGMPYEVLSHDDTTFTVKVFRIDPDAGAEVRKRKPTAEDKARVDATYRPDATDADLLTFAGFAEGLPTSGQWRNGFEIADMNGDGHLDIVHGPARKGASRRPHIFLGDGKGSWSLWREVKFPALGYDYGDVAVADFNGDKRPDLALAVHLRGVLVLVADGEASFKEWGNGVYFELPGRGGDSSGFTSRTVEAADWDGDRRVDLVLLGEGPRMAAARSIDGQPDIRPAAAYGVVVYLNRGDGSWERRTEMDNPRPVFGDDLEVADVDGDRRLDVVLGLNVLGSKQILRLGGAKGAWKVAEVADLRPGILTGAVHVADLDGDKRKDLAIGYMANELGTWRTGVDLFLARAKGAWERRTLFAEEGRRGIFALDGGDLDGDGHTDLVALTGDGEAWVFLGRRAGAFVREASGELPPLSGCRGYEVALVDLDGDGRDEIVAGFAGEASALFAPDKCVSGGSLQAWKAAPRREQTATSGGS